MKYLLILLSIILSSVNCVEFSCNFTEIDLDNFTVGKLKCEVTKIEIISYENRTIELKEFLASDKNKTNVEIFETKNQQVYFFPQNLANIFPYLRNIKINHAGLKSIKTEDIAPFKHNLEYLDLSNNELKIIESNLFDKNKFMIEISFSNNQIELIEEETFELDSLQILNLSGNVCTKNLNLGGESKPTEVLELIKRNRSCMAKLEDENLEDSKTTEMNLNYDDVTENDEQENSTEIKSSSASSGTRREIFGFLFLMSCNFKNFIMN